MDERTLDVDHERVLFVLAVVLETLRQLRDEPPATQGETVRRAMVAVGWAEELLTETERRLSGSWFET